MPGHYDPDRARGKALAFMRTCRSEIGKFLTALCLRNRSALQGATPSASLRTTWRMQALARMADSRCQYESTLIPYMEDFDSEDDLLQERPWIKWESTYDIEAWIDGYNRNLQRLVKDPRAIGYGICFILEPDGEIFLHTTSEGEVLIDVPGEAEWITPLLAKVIDSEPPDGQIWTMPVEKLTQLIMGLSGLAKATRMVTNHNFRLKKRYF